MNWYVSIVNTEIIPTSNEDVEENEAKLKKFRDKYFEDIRISTMTWKGSGKNGEKLGELVTPETKVNCYFNHYHIIICIDFSKSMHSYNFKSGKMLMEKAREAVKATLFNLKCTINKNDKINRESFEFNPKI